MPFFATIPITMIMPMKDATLKVVRVTSSATNAPKVESNADARIAIGAEKVPKFEDQNHEQKHQRQKQNLQQIGERFLLLGVKAAVFNPDR